MSTSEKISRWVESGDPALRELMQSARDDGPSREQLARIVSRATASIQPVPTAGVTTLKLSAASGAVACALFGTWLATRALPQRVAPSEIQRPMSAAPALPSASTASTAPVELTLEPRVEPEIERPPARVERTPRTRLRRTPTTAPASDPSAELELLQRARRAMPGDASRALDLLRSHERQFAQGTFAEEREVLWVEALLALGREPEARARSERLRKLAPATAYRRRIDELLERRRTLKLP